MATQSSSASTGVGSSSAPQAILRVVPTTRNPAVWCNFNMVEMEDMSIKAQCKRCGKILSAASNSTLKQHSDRSCEALRTTPQASQSTMSRDGTVFAYSVERCRQEFAQYVIQDALPFNHFDNPRFTKVIQRALQPRYNHVSRTTLKRDCLKLWKKAKEELINNFANLNTNVNLTTDVWSAPHNLPGSYLCVTAHWIQPETWQMMKRTIAFENFEYPHTAQNLFYMLRNVITMFKLEEKVFSMSFDNASNNTSCVKKLILKYKPPSKGTFFHGRCVAHILNLVVQDGLGLPEIDYARGEFKRMLQDVFLGGGRRYKQYMKMCHETDNPCLAPNWDVPTRWNSTYKMFLCGLKQRTTLTMFHDHLYASNKVLPFRTGNWEIVEQVCEFLKVFKTATTLLSGVYYPTSHLVLNQLFLICETIQEFKWKGDMYERMVEPMKAKLAKYFKEIPPIFACAAALNPCLNVTGVQLLIEKISNGLDLHEEDPLHVIRQNDKFLESFKDLFQYYFSKHNPTNEASSSQGSFFTSSSKSENPMMNFLNQLRSENTKRARGDGDGSYGGEFGRYTQTDFLASMGAQEFENFDILAWWKAREPQFPVLATMARDLLSAQASTVASESAFSLSGRVLTIRRTRLTPASLEMCICLKDHLDAAERVQDKSSLEGELDIEQELHDIEVGEGLTISLSDEEIALDEASRATTDNDEDFEDA